MWDDNGSIAEKKPVRLVQKEWLVVRWSRGAILTPHFESECVDMFNTICWVLKSSIVSLCYRGCFFFETIP